MLEEVLVSLLLLAVAAVGLALLFWPATEKLRALLSCLAWTPVEASVTSSRVVESRRTRHVSRLDPGAMHGADVEVSHDAWGGGTVTTTTVMPEVSFRLRLGERSLVVSNLQSSWNHAVGYSRPGAVSVMKRFARGTTHRLRVNPRAPHEVFLGWRHFPWLWAPVQWALGFFLGVAPLCAVVRPLLEWATADGHTAAQKLMIALACCSPAYAVGRAALDVIRPRPR